jgi:hypothetical protein
MLLEAVNWSPEWKFGSRRHVLSDPRIAQYITGWPRDTDLGLIAEAGSQPADAAWVRFFPADDPAYGFTSLDVPELTIGIAAPGAVRASVVPCCGPLPDRPYMRASDESASAWSGRTPHAACSDPQSDTTIKNLAHRQLALPAQASRPRGR